MAARDLVLVTGASGFIACHVVQQLLEEGYKVRGTVRSLQNEKKVRPLRELLPDAEHGLELVEADLNDADSWRVAVKGCKYVIHIASPFPSANPKHEDEVIKPAVEGTLNVLKAAHETGTVKRVVITSSIAAVTSGHDHHRTEPFSEKDWANLEAPGVSAYEKSKVLAEKAAWDYVAGLEEGDKLEIAVINPGYVIGPVLCGSVGTSQELPQRLLTRDMPMVPEVYFGTCDVRDVATAHIKAMTTPEAAGHRHLIDSGTHSFLDAARVLEKEFKPQGYNVPTMKAPKFILRVIGLFDPTVKWIVPMVGVKQETDNSRMKNVLGIEPRPYEDGMIDMAYSMIEHGTIPKTREYKGRPTH